MSTQIRIETDNQNISGPELEITILEIKSELEQSDQSGFIVDETKQENEGTLGPEWLPILVAVLSTPAAVETVKGIITVINKYIQRKKTIAVTLTSEKGSFKVTGENISDEEMRKIVSDMI